VVVLVPAQAEVDLGTTERCLFDLLEARIDGAVGFHGRDEDVEDPEEDKDGGGDCLGSLGASQFATNGRMPPEHQEKDCQPRFDHEDGDRKTQTSRLDLEIVSHSCMVNGCHGPCDADAEEDIDGVGSGHVSHGGIGSLVLNGGRFRGKSVRNRSPEGYKSDSVDGVLEVDETSEMTGDITNDSRAGTDEDDGDDKRDIPVVETCWGNEAKMSFHGRVRKCVM